MTERVQPFLRPQILFAFALGIAGLQRLPVLPDQTLCFFLMAITMVIWLWLPCFRVWAAFAAGALFAAWVADTALSQQLPLAKSGHRGEVVIEIHDLPKQQGDQWQFEGLVNRSRDFPELAGRRIRLSWYRNPSPLFPGDIYQLEVTLRTPNGVYNPGGFDAEQHALQKHWAAQGYVRRAISLHGHRMTIDRFRDDLSRQIRRKLGDDQARFVAALAIGDTRFLKDADWEVLRRTGISHLIAISGFHVGMVALAASWLIRALYGLFPGLGLYLPQPLASAIAAINAAVSYTALAGFALPTVRTALMIMAFMGCRLLKRNSSLVHAVALSMTLMLLWDPMAILASGFWLSFGGVLLLLGFMPKQANAGWFLTFIRAQWVVSIGLLPLSIAYFSQSTVIGPLVNLFAIPWISLVVVPVALLGCVCAEVPALADGLWQSAAFLMQGLWSVLLHLQKLTWTSWAFPETHLLAVFMALTGVVVLLLPRGIPARRLAVFLFLPLLWPQPEDIPEGQLRVAMIDVGQGTSILLRTRHHALLYDAGAGQPGGFSRGASAVLPALRALNVPLLHKVVISHGDNDHAGGLPAIRAGVSVAQIEASWRALPASVPHRECRAGQSWQWDGVHFSYLWPKTHDGVDNNRSCVLLVRSGARSLLLAGDITAEAEAQLLAEFANRLPAEVVLVPHHGSAGSSSEAFIAATHPRFALVSSGFQNRFRHPRREVIARYHAAGAETVNTVNSGWVELASTARGWMWVRRARYDDRRYWLHAPLEPAMDGY